jgi:hypothetical protein
VDVRSVLDRLPNARTIYLVRTRRLLCPPFHISGFRRHAPHLGTLGQRLAVFSRPHSLYFQRQVYFKRSFEPMFMLLVRKYVIWLTIRLLTSNGQASLFFTEVLLGVGNVMSIQWVSSGKITIGDTCTAQGSRAHFVQGHPRFRH